MASGDNYGVQSPNFGYLQNVPKGALDRFEPVRHRQTVKRTTIKFVRDPDYVQGEDVLVNYYGEVRGDSLGTTEVAEIQDVARGNKQRIQYTSANGRCQFSGKLEIGDIEGATINLDFISASGAGLRFSSALLGLSGGVASVLEPRGMYYQRNGALPFVTGPSAPVPLAAQSGLPFATGRVRAYSPPSLGQENTHVLSEEVQYAVLFQLSAGVLDENVAVPRILKIPDVAFEFWTYVSTPVFF